MIGREKRWQDYLLYVDYRQGGEARYSIGLPKDADLRVPDDLVTCAVFLGGRDNRGVFRAGGTAFLLGLTTPTHPGTGWPCLVTAKHNIAGAHRDFGNVWVRMNREDGTAEPIEITQPWETSDNEASDIAIIPFPDAFGFHPLPIPLRWAVTEEVIESHKIGPGDDLLIPGLFRRHAGTERNLPIVRHGTIAGMALEPLFDRDSGLPYDAYLAEVRSIGGLSGSPVLVSMNVTRWTGDADADRAVQKGLAYYLLGIVRGHWNKKLHEDDFGAHDDYAESEFERLNMGIAIVTPITDILPILERKLFVDYAKDMDAKLKSMNADDEPTEDFDADNEYDRFRDLTRKLVNTPKPKPDASES